MNQPSTHPPTRERRALIVEDDPMIARILADTLTDEGYCARHTSAAQEALDVMDGWLPDVILLDLMLAGMDGWAFRRAQRDLGDARAEVPVVIVSATRATEARMRELSAAAELLKPFDLEELLVTIDQVCADRLRAG
ncbi:MAG: response regulator [Dehalococcoidia bacterium]|nr:response regulator [Dehalococcoidia bacterium]